MKTSTKEKKLPLQAVRPIIKKNRKQEDGKLNVVLLIVTTQI